MKRRAFAAILAVIMLMSLLPMTALAEGDEDTSTITDVNGQDWTVTKTENEITLKPVVNDEADENAAITLTLDGTTLTISGNGAMPNLNYSTDTAYIQDVAGTYPWVDWKTNTTKIVIGDGVTSVGSKSFIAWKSVTSVEIGKDLKTIYAGAFAQLTACEGFTVDSENSYLTADDGVLYNKDKTTLYYYPCTKTDTSFEVPDSVTLIGYNAICLNDNLTSITVADGDSPLTIGYGSMFGNTALESVTLPARVEAISEAVFVNNTALEKIVCADENVKELVQENIGAVNAAVVLEGGGVAADDASGFTFSYDSNGAVITGYTGTDTAITIPSTVTVGETVYNVVAIGNHAFAETATSGNGTRAITSVTIPESVKSIGYEAFSGWGDYNGSDTLTKVTILSDTVELANRAFIRNTALTVDMTAVKNLICGTDVFISGQNLEINKENQEEIRNALNGISSGAKVYIGDTSDDPDGYYTYQDGTWTATYLPLTVVQEGLTYKITYSQDTPTAMITKYENLGGATELTIPAAITFEAFDGTQQTAAVTGIDNLNLRGNTDSHVSNGIKKLTVNVSNIVLNTTFVYWDDLEEIIITGSNVTCSGVASDDQLKKMSFSGDSLTIKSSGPVGHSPVTMLDLSQVSSITLGYGEGWGTQTPTFYQYPKNSTVVTEVYVKDAEVYETIKTGTRSETDDTVKSGFNFDDTSCGRNIVYVVNGGTVDTDKTGFAAVSKQGRSTVEWYEDAACETETTDTTPQVGKTYYAKWTLNAPTVDVTADETNIVKDTGTATLTATTPEVDGVTYTYQWYTGDPANGGSAIKDANQPTYEVTNLESTTTYYCMVTAESGGDKSEAVTSEGVTISVANAEGSVTIADSKTTATYGDDPFTFTYTTASGTADVKSSNTSVATVSKGNGEVTVTIVGAGSTTISVSSAASDEYTAASAEFTLTVDKATLTATYAGETIDEGEEPKLEVTVTGFVNGETAENAIGYEDPTLTNNNTAAGSYKLTPAGGSAANYDFTYVAGTLTIRASDTPSPDPGNGGTSGGSHSSSGSSSASATYAVTVDSTKNGTVAASPRNAKKDDTVTLTVTPKDGYELDDLTVTDKNGKSIKVTEGKNGKFTFTMPAGKVTVEATFAKIAEQPKVAFVDVPTSAYYYDAVAWAVENGVTGGTTATTFSPNAPCTRAQAVTFLWRAAGSPAPKTSANPFTDIQPGAYYYDAVLWAVENGITAGTSATTFNPDTTCTRAQIVTFLFRAGGADTTGANPFADVADSAYYAGAVAWAVSGGITTGTSATTFSPSAPCTRAQIVTFLYRAEA